MNKSSSEDTRFERRSITAEPTFWLVCLGSICVALLHFAGSWVGALLFSTATGLLVLRRQRKARKTWLIEAVTAAVGTWSAGSALWLTLHHVWRHIARLL